MDIRKPEAKVMTPDNTITPQKHPCTCHPSDNPPKPCAEKYALSECLATPQAGEKLVERLQGYAAEMNGYTADICLEAATAILTLQSQLEEVQNECLKQARLAETADYALQDYSAYIERAETAEAEVVKLRAALDTLTDQAGAYMDVTKEYFSDSAYDANGLLAETDAALFVTLYDLRRARAALGGGE